MDETLTLRSAGRRSTPPPFSASDWLDGGLSGTLIAPLVDCLLALPALSDVYRRMPDDGRAFWDRALAALNVTYSVAVEDVDGIPKEGSLVVVANHPYGGVDGLILGSLLRRVRPDVRILGNYLLSRLPELRQSILPVDPFQGRASGTMNASAMRAALKWLNGGGALAVFPAGEVSHPSTLGGPVSDGEWSDTSARLAARTGASVVTVFFEGGNSRLFNAVGWVHPRLRTAMLVRELLALRGRTIAVRVGKLIPSERIERFASASDLNEYLRVRTYALGSRAAGVRQGQDVPSRKNGTAIAHGEPAALLAREIGALAPSEVLSRSGPFTVCIAGADAIPRTLLEVGRLREIAFRAAGEGSGRNRDLDRFDEHYRHLLVWNHERGEIVGSYRMGQTDRIVPRLGVRGLYTNTLFQYDRRLLDEMGPSLELGRAFVRPEYQRDYLPLLLLWKGIGAFVARNPRYRTLFGTVSISNDYQSLSQQILARFLYATSFRGDLGALVRPRNASRLQFETRTGSPFLTSVVRTVADVGALIAEIESDGKGIPVLLRQYLKLNARLLGFNVDPAFGNVLDGLMMVDLMSVEPDVLSRYMGKAGARDFRAFHAEPPVARRSA